MSYDPQYPRCPNCGEPVIERMFFKGCPVLVCNCVGDFLLSVGKDGKQTLHAFPSEILPTKEGKTE